MGKKIVRVASSKADAKKEADAINKNLAKRNIKRESYVCRISKSYVRKRTRKGYSIPKQSYGICMRGIK